MKPHKFFDAYLDNDLGILEKDMLLLRDSLISGDFENIPKERLVDYQNKKDSMDSQVTGLAGYYNIFTLGYSSVDRIKDVLGDLTLEACDYYEVDPKPLDYQIRGWLNVTYGSPSFKEIDRAESLSSIDNFHEHNDGLGMPGMHGYYSVSAEPSITYYLINKTELYENHNINNRVVLSETGHPHRIDWWEYETPRITIAYDVCPKEMLDDGISIPLW